MGNTRSVASDDVINRNDAETSIVVWLNSEINSSEEKRKAQKQLRTIVKHLKTFEDRNKCEQYIRSISSQDRLVLIVNSQQGREIVPHIHGLRQVTSIYVHGKDKKGNEQWTNHFTKVK
jgi:plasmid stabilization system protein ParE